MGFNTSSTTINLTAKLTPLGRQKLISTNNALITSFSLGDSDANYSVTEPLTSGFVPSIGGNAEIVAGGHVSDQNRANGVNYPEAFGAGPTGHGYPAGTVNTGGVSR